MSTASLAAYDAIIPELPAREAAVLGVLRKRYEDGRGGSGRDQAMTNRQIAGALGLERDSVSPRTARLRHKGLLIEVGIDDKETLYSIIPDPKLATLGRRKPKAYAAGLVDLLIKVEERHSAYPLDVFPEPQPGEHGSVDGCSARAARHILRIVVKDIHELIEAAGFK